MKVTIINASPRKNGNSSFIADKLINKFAEADYFFLPDLNFSTCTGCYACRNKESLCVIKDDLSLVYDSLISADLILFISPNYYGYITGIGKMFLDRCFCLKTKERRSKFKKEAKSFFILTQGSQNRSHGDNTQQWAKNFFTGFNMKFLGMTIPGCSYENTDGARLRMDELTMNINFFI